MQSQHQQQPQPQSPFVRDPAAAAAGAYVYFQATGQWPPGWAQQMQQLQPQQQNQDPNQQQQWNLPVDNSNSLPPHLQFQMQNQNNSMLPPNSPASQQTPGVHSSWQFQNDTLSRSMSSNNHQMQNQQAHSTPSSAYNSPVPMSNLYSTSAPGSAFDSPVASPTAAGPSNEPVEKKKSQTSNLAGASAAKAKAPAGRAPRGRPPGGGANSKRKRAGVGASGSGLVANEE